MRKRFFNLRIPAGGNSSESAELVVDHGRFVSIEPAGVNTGGDEEWHDLGGALVLPGVIDGHVHFDEPGFEHREDFASGTAAAAAGGVTCVVDMPCTSIPPVTDVAALETKVAAITGRARVDFMLWGGVSGNCMGRPAWQDDLTELVREGVAAIKVYMTSGMVTFEALRREQLRQVMLQAHHLGIPVAVHAEDADLVQRSTNRLRGAGEEGPGAWSRARPAEAEVLAVGTLRDLCYATGASVHVVHLGSGEALDLICAAHQEGIPMTAETCPHYLEFTASDLERLGSVLKTAPPVKSASDRDRLWAGLDTGDLEFVTTDHAPGQWPEEKHTGSIWTDYGGVPGVELLLPYLYSEGVHGGRITLERLTELTSSAPARFFGIDRRKGRLAPGLDADFVVVDEDATWTVHADGLHNKNRYTPLEGKRLTGRVREVYLRGECVFRRATDGDEEMAPPGSGLWIRRSGWAGDELLGDDSTSGIG